MRIVFLTLAVALMAGCQSPSTPSATVQACRESLQRFDAAMESADASEIRGALFCTDEVEELFAKALVDFRAATLKLDQRGASVFGESKWTTLRANALGIKWPQWNLAERPIVLANDAAIAIGQKGEGDVYLIRQNGKWMIQCASMFDRAESRAANLHIFRTLADGIASIADKLGTQIKTEPDLRHASFEMIGLLVFGDRTSIRHSPPATVPTIMAEPVLIPDADSEKMPFMQVGPKK